MLRVQSTEYGTNFLNNHEELAAFLKFLSHSNLKMTFDIGCMKMSSPSESITESMFANKKFIKHVHNSEPNLSIAPKISELEEITLMLKKIHYKGWISLEVLESRINFSDLENSLDNDIFSYKKNKKLYEVL